MPTISGLLAPACASMRDHSRASSRRRSTMTRPEPDRADWYAQDRPGLLSLGARARNLTGRFESRWTSAAVRTAQAPSFSDDRVEPSAPAGAGSNESASNSGKDLTNSAFGNTRGRPHQAIAPRRHALNLRCLAPRGPFVLERVENDFANSSLSGREDLDLRPFSPETAVAASHPVRTVRK